MQILWLRFFFGYYKGFPVGLWNGLTGLVEGIGTLIQLGSQLVQFGYRVSPAGITETAIKEIAEFIRDPGDYAADIQAEA